MTPEALYIIDYALFQRWNIAMIIRKSIMIAYVSVLCYPISRTYEAFLKFRKQKIYQLKITPQVCYIERLLNDRFDYTGRRIEIIDGEVRPATYLYLDDELKPEYFYTDAELRPRYIYTDAESAATYADFIVRVPADVVFNDQQMKSLIKQFCLAGKTFKIQIV